MILQRPVLRLFTSISSLVLVSGLPGLAQVNARKEPAVYSGPGAPAPDIRRQPPSRLSPMGRPRVIALGRLSAEERGKLGAVGLKRRIGVHRTLPEGALDAGTWGTLADGRAVWRLEIQSADANGIRVEFSDFSVGDGKVWVYSGDSIDGPYIEQGPYGNGEFWSGTVDGESAVVEYEVAPGGKVGGAPPFHIHRVAHQETGPARDAQPAIALAPLLRATPFEITRPGDRAASCNLDVNCYPDWKGTKRSVAHIQFEETLGDEQGTFLCSGSLVATRDNSFKPYLLTAGHCIHDEAAARSLQTFWAYESTGCNLGRPPDRGTLNSSPGGHLVAWATIEEGDYSLVLLPDVPSGVVFSGWDTGDLRVGSPVVGIHHPHGSYKRISFGSTISGFDVFVGTDPAPAALYHEVVQDQGITEPGSSGSPLFSAPNVVVGMLSYGPALSGEELCTVGDFGGYGKFSNAYGNLQPYLEDFPVTIVTPSATSLRFTGLNHAITGSATQTVTLSVDAKTAVTFGVRADAPWVQVSPASGTVSASAPAKIQVTVDPRYFVRSDSYTTTVTILSGAAPPQFVNVRVDMKIENSSVVVSAIPNPVPETGTTWQLTLQVQETSGAATQLTALRIDGVDYSSNIAGWFGDPSIAANGTINATIHTSGLVTPVDKFFEFFGRDTATGQNWYRTLTVTFTP